MDPRTCAHDPHLIHMRLIPTSARCQGSPPPRLILRLGWHSSAIVLYFELVYYLIETVRDNIPILEMTTVP